MYKSGVFKMKSKTINGHVLPRKQFLIDKSIAIITKIEEKLKKTQDTIPTLTLEKLETELKEISKIIISEKLTTKYYTGLLSRIHNLKRSVGGI